MNRRDFLKLSSMTALLAAREWTGLSKVFAQFPSPSKSNYLSRSNPLGNMEHRNLGGLLNVSVIGFVRFSIGGRNTHGGLLWWKV